MGLKDRIYYKALNYVPKHDLKKLLKNSDQSFNANLEMAETAKMLSFYFHEIDVMVDVGPHKGKFAHSFNSFIKTKNIICIEPNISLNTEIRNNNPQLKIEIVACGLAEKEGKSDYFEQEVSSMNSIIESDKKVLAEKFPYYDPSKLQKNVLDIPTFLL